MLLADELPLSEAESRLLDQAREFSRREVGPNAARWERERVYPRETIRAAAALGLTRIQVPAAQGGLDLRFRCKVRIVEEIARDDFAFAFALVNTHNSAIAPRARRQRQPARALSGRSAVRRTDRCGVADRALGRQRFCRDTHSRRTRRRRLAAQWREGLAHQRRRGRDGRGLCANRSRRRRQGHRRLRRRCQARGLRARRGVRARRCARDRRRPASSSINYFAADDDLFYAPGAAFKSALGSITGARIYVAAMCCGMVEEALELALARAWARSTFGRPLIERQGMRWMLADVATDLDAARLLVYRAVRLLEAGQDAVLAAAHAKKFATRMAEQRLPQCMQVFGAEGLMEAHPIGRHLAAARAAHYADGSTEMQNERIAVVSGARHARRSGWNGAMRRSEEKAPRPFALWGNALH